MSEERFYRALSRPPDLMCYEVRYKESDLFCCTESDIRDRILERVIFYRRQLETYIATRPEFRNSLSVLPDDPFAPRIAREMLQTSAMLNVGPMATVAGAVAEFVGRDIMGLSREFILENGGDIFLRTERDRLVAIYAKDSPYSRKTGIRLRASPEPYGVCTSSATVGPSLSLGRADAVCIIAGSSLVADGVATYVGNRVNNKADISTAIEQGSLIPGVKGILVIVGDGLGAWGDIEIITI